MKHSSIWTGKLERETAGWSDRLENRQTERDGQTNRQMDTEMDRQIDREMKIDIKRDGHAELQTERWMSR